MLPLDDIV